MSTLQQGQIAAPINSHLTVEICVTRTCGVLFGLESNYRAQKLKDGTPFHCPNGHSQWYTRKQNRESELEAQLANTARQLEWSRDEVRSQRGRLELEKRRTAAYKGQLTRLRRRVANGVCVVAGCKRSFDGRDPAVRHLHTEHHAWVEDHAKLIHDAGLDL